MESLVSADFHLEFEKLFLVLIHQCRDFSPGLHDFSAHLRPPHIQILVLVSALVLLGFLVGLEPFRELLCQFDPTGERIQLFFELFELVFKVLLCFDDVPVDLR